MKLNIELYLKVDILGTGWVYKRPITGTGKETYGYSRLLVVLEHTVIDRNGTLTLCLTLILTITLAITLTLKITVIYAVQLPIVFQKLIVTFRRVPCIILF